MHQNSVTLDSAGAITRYFAKANLHTQQETLGEIVTEILKDGRNLSRKSLCAKTSLPTGTRDWGRGTETL